MGDKRKMMITINSKQYESGELVAYVEKLEKENAELKQKVIDLENDREIFLSDFYCDKKGTCKFTEAKEILKKFMKFYERTARECYSKDFQKTLAEAEQFLKDCEVEK